MRAHIYYDSLHEYKCPRCKNTDVEIKAWAKLNTNPIEITDYNDEAKDDIDYWCNDCCDHITPEYVEKNNDSK